MTVTVEVPIASSTANGIATSFPYSFTLLDDDDLVVTGTAGGVTTTYTNGVDYTVTGVGTGAGSVEFVSPPASGVVVTRYRSIELKRETDYQNNGDFKSDVVDRDFDRIWFALQDVLTGGNASVTALRVPNGETIPAFPDAASRAGYYVGFDGAGDPALLLAASGTAAALAADLASTSDVSKNDAMLGVKRTEAGAVGTTQHVVNEQRAIYLKADAGAAGDDASDDRGALALADTMAAGAQAIYIPPGTYRINSNITVSSMLVFAPGAVLKPANGVVVTLNHVPEAGVHRIFDLSLAGSVRLPFNRGVWVDWWGAKADGTTDSAAAFQAACDAMIAPDPDGNAGVLNLTSGTYEVSTFTAVKNRIVIRGQGFGSTEIRVTTGFSATRIIEFKNGTSSQFGCRLEQLQLTGRGKTFSSGMIYAPSWNEHCGLENVHLRQLGGGKGVYVDQFYGGSAQSIMQGVEVVGHTTLAAGTIGIHLIADPGIVNGWNAVQLKHVSVTNAGGAAANLVGIQLENRLLADVEALHFEDQVSGLYLVGAASVCGGRLQGGPNCTNLIDIASGWTGTLHLDGVKIGNATKKLRDSRAAGYTYFENGDTPEPLIFPPEPGQIMAAARCTGGATPVVSGGNAWAKRISGVTRNSAGSYRFTLSPGFGAQQNHHAWAISHETGFRACRTIQQTSSTFDVIFEDAAGAAVETTDFTVWVTHKP